jgi:hypothetical protein
MVKLRSVAAAIRVQFPLGTQPLQELEPVFDLYPVLRLLVEPSPDGLDKIIAYML